VNNLPDRPASGGEILPARPLSNQQFEMVIRRAAELQARGAEEPGSEAMSEEEVIRIGRELGLSAPNLHRALAEVRGQQEMEDGTLVRMMGPARLSASRSVAGDPVRMRSLIEAYLLDREYMTVERRHPDRTTYVRASGIFATLGRATTGAFGSTKLLDLERLDVSVAPLEEGVSYVTLSTDLSGTRNGYLAGAAVSSGSMGAVSGLTLAIAVAPPVALVALPVMGAVYWGIRQAYEVERRKRQTQLEALLDRVEYGELPTGRQPRRRF
jgi:hypothetical protein